MSTNDPKAADKLMAGQPEGGMLIWRPKTGWEDVPEAAMISADNGVAASSDGKQLFVAGSGDETVVRLSLGGIPGDRVVIKTGFHTDNLRWGSVASSTPADSATPWQTCGPALPTQSSAAPAHFLS